MSELPEELRKALFYVVDKDNKIPDLKARYSTCTGNLLEADVVASFLEETRESSCSAEVLIAWLNDEKRKPSSVAFTDGNERRVAWHVENMINTILEGKKKELKEKIDANLTKEMRRLFTLEKKYKKKGDFKQERTYYHCGMTLGINAKREVRNAFVAVFGEESERKCFNCNKKLEKWLDTNKDANGNEYCADCVAKVELVAEQEEDGGENGG